jgi:predicted Zn-dependent protease
VVNDATISSADIEDQVNSIITRDPDPYLRAYYLDPATATKEARQRALDARISSLLIAAEAKKRGKSSDELIEMEINSRIRPPTESEIKATYDANRDQIGTADLESVRPELINFIRNQRSQELYAALITRLKMTNAVSRHADVNAANLAPGTVRSAIFGLEGSPLDPDPITNAVSSTYQQDISTAATEAQTSSAQAVDAYKKITLIRPKDPAVQLELAQAAQSAGDTATTVAAYKAFLVLAPQDPTAPEVRRLLKQLQKQSG